MITILRWHVARENLGRLVEGQGHSMTLQQNHVWPITWLFAVRFNNYFWQTTSVSNTYSGSITRFDRLLFWTKVVLFGCMVKYIYFFYLFITVFSFDDSVIWTRPLFMFINDVVNDQKRITVLNILWSSWKDTTLYHNCLFTLSPIANFTLGCSRKKCLGWNGTWKWGYYNTILLFFLYSPYGNSWKRPHLPNLNWFPIHPHPLAMPFSLEQPLVKMFI